MRSFSVMLPAITTTHSQSGQFLAGNRFAEGKAKKLSSPWADRHQEVLKAPFFRNVVVIQVNDLLGDWVDYVVGLVLPPAVFGNGFKGLGSGAPCLRRRLKAVRRVPWRSQSGCAPGSDAPAVYWRRRCGRRCRVMQQPCYAFVAWP